MRSGAAGALTEGFLGWKPKWEKYCEIKFNELQKGGPRGAGCFDVNSSFRSVAGGELSASLPRRTRRFVPAGQPRARAWEGAAALGELQERETPLMVVLSKSPFRPRWQDSNLGIFSMD